MFEYDSEKIQVIIDKINDLKEQNETNFKKIGKVGLEISTCWEGEAATAFLSRVHKLYSTCSSFTNELEKCTNYLYNSNKSKIEAEESINNLISNMF